MNMCIRDIKRLLKRRLCQVPQSSNSSSRYIKMNVRKYATDRLSLVWKYEDVINCGKLEGES